MTSMRNIVVVIFCILVSPGSGLCQTARSDNFDTTQTYVLRVYVDTLDWQSSKPQLAAQITPERFFVESKTERVKCPNDECASNVDCLTIHAVSGVLHIDAAGRYSLDYSLVEVHPFGNGGVSHLETPALELGASYSIGFCGGLCRSYTVIVTRAETLIEQGRISRQRRDLAATPSE